MKSRFIIYGVISVFTVGILFQLNTYLAIINWSTVNNDSVPEQQHQQAYHVLIMYLLLLTSLSLFTLFIYWSIRRRRLIIRYTSWSRWLEYEHSFFELFHFNLGDITAAVCLAGINFILIYYLPITTFSNSRLTQQQQQLHVLSNRAAQLAVTNFAFAVALSAKVSVVQTYFVDMHQTVRLHTWFSCLGYIQVLYHACFQLQSNYEKQGHDLFLTVTTNIRYFSGITMMVAMTILLLGSHSMVRNLSYGLFRYTHFLGLFTMILMGCLHHWLFYLFYASVLLFWVMDQLDKGYLVPFTELEGLPGDLLRLKCKLPYPSATIIPGQFVLLSYQTSFLRHILRSHPFSICRIDHQENSAYFTFYIKVVGGMTRELAKIAQEDKVVIKNQLRISKPLGLPYLVGGAEFGSFESIVLIAEGVGITPWISVLHYLTQRQHTIKTTSVDIIWSIHTIGKAHDAFCERDTF